MDRKIWTFFKYATEQTNKQRDRQQRHADHNTSHCYRVKVNIVEQPWTGPGDGLVHLFTQPNSRY